MVFQNPPIANRETVIGNSMMTLQNFKRQQ
jgi:hypothetical protein